jgi:hypothetical protein
LEFVATAKAFRPNFFVAVRFLEALARFAFLCFAMVFLSSRNGLDIHIVVVEAHA